MTPGTAPCQTAFRTAVGENRSAVSKASRRISSFSFWRLFSACSRRRTFADGGQSERPIEIDRQGFARRLSDRDLCRWIAHGVVELELRLVVFRNGQEVLVVRFHQPLEGFDRLLRPVDLEQHVRSEEHTSEL